MYKYVQRRLRDIVERTYNYLDVKKNWTCPEKAKMNGQVGPLRPTALRCMNEVHNASWDRCFSSFSSPKSNEKCHRNRYRYRPEQLLWAQALTWSSAIVFGYYTTQVLSWNRNKCGIESRCFMSKIMCHPIRAVHTRFGRVAFAATLPTRAYDPSRASTPQRQPKYQMVQQEVDYDSGVSVQESEKSYRTPDSFEDHEELYDIEKFEVTEPIPWSMPAPQFKSEKPKKQPTSGSESIAVESVVTDLLSVLGNMEFELGQKSIEAKDFQRAVSHLKFAAAHHHASATFNLGICFENGLGVKRDMQLALECYQAASDLGHPKAMYNLGVFYAMGLGGLKKSRKAARSCFLAAAQLGIHEAKIALGMPTEAEEIAAAASFGAINTQTSVLVA